MQTIFLIDGSAYTWRAFHAYKMTVREIDHLPINAVKGFCEMTWRFLKRGIAGHEATHLAVVFDHTRSRTLREKIFPEYKAQRPPPPDEIRPQFSLIRRAVKAFGISMIEQEGHEADDLIATYARQAVEDGMSVVVVSGDKDFLQLVREDGLIGVFDPFWQPPSDDPDQHRGKLYTADQVEVKMGVRPAQVAELQALMGDVVDNIPGVKGIGPKSGVKLIRQLGTIDRVIKDMAFVEPKGIREKLFAAGEETIRLSHKLTTLYQDVDVEYPLDETILIPPDPERLIAYTRAVGLPWLTGAIGDHFEIDPTSIAPEALTASVGAGTSWRITDG